MEKWHGRIAVVTGSSAGIGAAIFTDLANAGITVVGMARRKEKMEEIIAATPNAAGKMYAVECDVSDESSIKAAFSWIEANLGGVDILVNNAGCNRFTTILTEGNEDDLRAVIDTNLTGLLLCTKEAFRSMKARDHHGFIINVNSIVGHKIPFPGPTVRLSSNVYPSTKYAVTAATEVLRQELIFMKNDKIRVSSISPGVVRTELRKAAGYPDEKMYSYDHVPCLDPEDISDAIMYLLSTAYHVNITEMTVKPVGEPF